MPFRIVRAAALGSVSLSLLCLDARDAAAQSTTELPEITVRAPSPIRRAPRRVQAPATAVTAAPAAPETPLQGALPIVTDQFATVTVVPREELNRSPSSTLGDVLFSKPGVTGSSFAPGASSRPVIRGLDVNRVGIVSNGTGGGGVSDLGEDHFVPINPLTTGQIEVIRGPATLRYGSQSIGGVVSATDNRIPEALPCSPASSARPLPGASNGGSLPGCATFEMRSAVSSADHGVEGGVLLDAGAGNFAFHADAFGRRSQSYRIPAYPYLGAVDPLATQPGNFDGRQPNSWTRSDEQSAGGTYLFFGGFSGLAFTRTQALYAIPGIDGDAHHTRINALQDKVFGKGEYRPGSGIDAIRYWWGYTDYKHNEIGFADPTDPATDGVRQTFTNKDLEGRIEVQFSPFNLRFAELTTALGMQGGAQELTAPSPDNAGLWDPNTNQKIAGYIFNELKFSPGTKAQIAGRIEHIDYSGMGRNFIDPILGGFVSTPASPGFTPKSISFGLIHDLPRDLVASVTAQRVERAPKPAELFSGGGHDATATFDKGNPNLRIETAYSVEAGLRRAKGPIRFEATGYLTRFDGFIFRRLTGNTCDGDTGMCGAGFELKEAIYSQRDAIFRGGEFQFQWDVKPMGSGFLGVEGQYDIVRATFTDGTNVPRIPPQRLGGGIYFRSAEWFGRINLLHAFAQNDIAVIGETPTAGYNLLKAELSRTRVLKNDPSGIKQVTVGVVGNNLLNADIRNHVSYTKDEVLMPGASVRLFANVKF